MRKLIAIAGLFFGILCAGQAAAETKPVLRPKITTLAEVVTIGDFYSFAGPFADVPLFRSPDVGTSGTVPAEDVVRRARAAGMINAGTSGLTKVEVIRQAAVYDTTQLKDLAAKALSHQDAGLTPKDLQITFYRAPATIQADPSADEPVHVDRVLWSRNDGRFTLYLSVAGSRGTYPLSLNGYALETTEVAVLAQPVQRGTVLKAQDLVITRMPVAQVPARALLDYQDILGLSARRNLRANMPISRDDFEHPMLVARGDKVTITFYMPGMKLTTRGEAMESGAEGDAIDIKNLQSGRIIPAVVTSRGQVQIQSLPAQVASLEGGAK